MVGRWMGGLMLAWGVLAQAAEDYATWGNARDLIVDASASNLAADVTGFPLALTLGSESSDLFSQAKPDGGDLRFSAEDGTHLAYQIESWDAASRKAAVWVRLPTVKAGQPMRIRAHWGKSSAVDSSSGPAVFRAQDGFQGVWHMASMTSMADASANAVTAQDSGTAADAGGRIGAARAFPNTNAYATQGAYLALGNPAALNLHGVITLEAWVKWTRRDGHRIILCHGAAPGGGAGAQYETVLRIGETQDYRAGVWTGTEHYAKAAAAPSDSGVWVHLAGVFDGGKWILYRNGARLAASAADTNGAKPSPGAWRIGAEYANGVTRYFAGSLDEVRISSVARGEDWFKLAYATQKEGQTAVKWAAPSGVRRMGPGRGARSPRPGAGIWAAPKPGGTGYIDARGVLLPGR